MATLCQFLCLILTIFLFENVLGDTSADPQVSPHAPPPSIQKPQGTYTLALFWPTGFCSDVTLKPPCNRKGLKDLKYFTIHGLWPSKKAQCKKLTEEFNEDLLKDIHERLNEVWPDLQSETKKGDPSFWEHEWNDHGRICPIGTVLHDYFAHTLALYKELDPNVIKRAGFPDTPETIKALFSGKEPALLCVQNVTGHTFLSQLYFRLDDKARVYGNYPSVPGSIWCKSSFKIFYF